MPEEKNIYITPDEAKELVDILDCYLFQMIRDDDEIDNMDWLCKMCRLYEKLSGKTEGGVEA